MKKIMLIILGVFVFCSVYSQGYKIEVKVKGVANQDLILGIHKGENLVPVDTAKADKNGYGVFTGKKTLSEGMYFVFLPSKTYFDFILGKDQTFLIENDTIDLINNLKITGALEGQYFVDYHKFLMTQNKQMTLLSDQYKIETDAAKKKELEDQMKVISQTFDDYYNKLLTEHPEMFLVTFLKATRDISVPATITDRMQQWQYYKSHYFDNFDLSDVRLLYTPSPIYTNKIDTYLDKIVFQIPDSLNKEIDMMLGKAKKDSTLYQYLLIHIYNKYAKSQLMIAENILSHVIDIYVETAYWSPDSFKNEINTKNIRRKNCLIGNQAKPLKMTIVPADSIKIQELRIPLADMKQRGLDIEKDKARTFDQKIPDLSNLIAEYMSHFPNDIELYNIKAKYTIIWFMSPTCSHCVTETPLLYQKYVDELQSLNVVVLSVFLEANTDDWANFSENITKWFDFIQKHKMYAKGWYNVWNPFDNFRYKYDISSSPVLYLLDKDKKIVAKKIGYEQAIEIIKEMEKYPQQ